MAGGQDLKGVGTHGFIMLRGAALGEFVSSIILP